MKRLIQFPLLHIVDVAETCLTGDVLEPLAFDEWYCRRAGMGSPPLIHFWRHKKAMVLGLRDRRLPQAADAVEHLRKQGCAVAVRNSGGAAVPLDEGVLNVSVILPGSAAGRNFRADFSLLAEWIEQALRLLAGDVRIQVGEVQGAYCPGDFDLSVGGRKFCGIAQRRQIDAFILQAFIVTDGQGAERAEQVRQFYRIASGGLPPDERFPYPLIHPDRTASLREALGECSVESLVAALKKMLPERFLQLPPPYQDGPLSNELRQMADTMRERYDKDR
ncbi:lipoate--protein ligase family protein [Ferviditalea candida]|uniref:Lipoate--protein ligase family protein n=1 Tax=Ferviditalea candida TaxID=3108399 RepID=A0ABU5ZJ39_9BACL|nr:lipoate--protein ligase family protein [Paenibacillaceae bacterium T2]